MEDKGHHDDFDTFLTSVQKTNKADGSNTTTMRIMTMLSRVGKTDVVKLMTMVDISWSEFTEGVNALREAGLIDMDEDDKTAVIGLTKEGSRWAIAMSSTSDSEGV